MQVCGEFIKIIATDRSFDRLCAGFPTTQPQWSASELFRLLPSAGSPLITVFHPKSSPWGGRAVSANQGWLTTIVEAAYRLTGNPVKHCSVISQVIWCHSFNNFYECLHARLQEWLSFLTKCKIKQDNFKDQLCHRSGPVSQFLCLYFNHSI